VPQSKETVNNMNDKEEIKTEEKPEKDI